MMAHEIRTEGGFRLYSENDLQRLKFIRYGRQLGFSLEAIRELLSIHICQKSKSIVQSRLREVEAMIAELQHMQRSLQRLNDACCGTAHSSVYCSILESLEKRRNCNRGDLIPDAYRFFVGPVLKRKI